MSVERTISVIRSRSSIFVPLRLHLLQFVVHFFLGGRRQLLELILEDWVLPDIGGADRDEARDPFVHVLQVVVARAEEEIPDADAEPRHAAGKDQEQAAPAADYIHHLVALGGRVFLDRLADFRLVLIVVVTGGGAGLPRLLGLNGSVRVLFLDEQRVAARRAFRLFAAMFFVNLKGLAAGAFQGDRHR